MSYTWLFSAVPELTDNACDDGTEEIGNDKTVFGQTFTDSGDGITADKLYKTLGQNCPNTRECPPAPVKKPQVTENSAEVDDEFAFAYFDVMPNAKDNMSIPITDNSRCQSISGCSEGLNKGPRAAAAIPTDRMIVNEKYADSSEFYSFQGIQYGPNNDHNYVINPFAHHKPLHHINYHSNQPTIRRNKVFYRNRCKMLCKKVKCLRHKLDVLIALQREKETVQACVQTDPMEGIAQDKLNKQLIHKYEQALKEIHKWKTLCTTLQKLKSEPGTIQAKEIDVNGKSNVNEVYRQLEACCAERDQYKSEVEQIKQQKLQMDSEINQFRNDVEQLCKEMQDMNSASTSRDGRESTLPEEMENNAIMRESCKETNKRRKCLRSLKRHPVKKPHLTVSETGAEEDSTPKPNRDNSKPQKSIGLSSLTTGSISTGATSTDIAAINMKADSGGCANLQASQQVPNTNDNGTITETELLPQSFVPAVDLDKDYYQKHFKELSVKVKQLENQLAVAGVQKLTIETSQGCIQTDPIQETMQDNARKRLKSQYEEAMKEVQLLTEVCNTLQKAVSKAGSTPAKESGVQSMSKVDKIAIQADQVFRQLDTCCTERDLYKSEVEQLNQQISQMNCKNGQLRTEMANLKKMTRNKASTITPRDKSAKLQNLRMNLARLLTILLPDQTFQQLSCDDDTVDDILQQVLKETKT